MSFLLWGTRMPLQLSWFELALRLLLTTAAGAVIGFNRESRGHAAGLRTTILVGLAACVAMLQANLLLSVVGKTPSHFAEMDLMRLPLGILTGVGFIGGGAILRRGDLVTGVTTAATLWMMSVIGLCIGGGQIALGMAATGLGFVTLWGLRSLDRRMSREHRAILVVAADATFSAIEGLPELVRPLGYQAHFLKQDRADARVDLSFEVCWRQPETAPPPVDLLKRVQSTYEVRSFERVAESHH